VFGKANGAAVDLATVAAGTGGFVINGTASCVSAAGDVNGDGLADLIVKGSTTNYVVYGKSTTTAVDLTVVAKGIGGFEIAGASSYVSAAGDVNGDGLADLIVGVVLGGSSSTGQSYVIFGGTSLGSTVDQLGTIGADTLTGSSISETLVGNSGNDLLIGNGGADVLYGGTGDDIITLNLDNVAQLSAGVTAGNYARVDGGSGMDTIALAGAGITFDLTTVANQGQSADGSHSRISSIEKIDLTGSGNNTIKLSVADVLDMSGMNQFNNATGWADGTYNLADGITTTEARHQLIVTGNAGDVVNLSGGVNWTNAGTVTNGGHTYDVYNSNAAAGQLLIDQLLTYNAVA
jgi:hypothetical protein